MSYRRFEIPSRAELSEVDRVSLLEGSGDLGVLALRAVADDGDFVDLTLDALGRSIRLVWISDGRRLVDVYREGAMRFDVSQAPGSPVLRIAVEYDDAEGLPGDRNRIRSVREGSADVQLREEHMRSGGEGAA